MITEEKYIKLRDGRDALLRSPSADDAEEMLGFLKKIATETDFLLRGADDPLMPLEDEKKYLEKNRGSENDLMICCFIDDNGTYRLAGIHPDALLMPDGTLRNEYLMIKKL